MDGIERQDGHNEGQHGIHKARRHKAWYPMRAASTQLHGKILATAPTCLLQSSVKDTSDIVRLSQISKERHKVRELRVMGIIEPRRHGDSVVRMEDVRRRGVIDDDRVRNRAAKLRQILHTQKVRHCRSMRTPR